MYVHVRASMFKKYVSAGSPISATLQKSHVIYLVVKLSCGKNI